MRETTLKAFALHYSNQLLELTNVDILYLSFQSISDLHDWAHIGNSSININYISIED